MWQWTLNWDEIRDDLLIGSCPRSPSDVEKVRMVTGATAFLSLQTDECRKAFAIDHEALRQGAADLTLVMANTPMRDFDPPDQQRNLPAAVRQLAGLLANGHRVYVHCTSGINRSPLVTLGYLTFVESIDYDDALALIRARRLEADPSLEAYYGCRQDMLELLRDHIEVHAYYLAGANPGDAEKHWFRAETEILRQAFTSPRSLPLARLDPSRIAA